MPEIRATRSVPRTLTDVWDFVEDMDNWAPMLEGYVDHSLESDRESIWTLRGDVGPLSRKVRMRVRIVEWTEHRRVAFELEGIEEDVRGSGAFDMSEEREELVLAVAEPPRRSWWQRFLGWLFRRPEPAPEEPLAPLGDATSHVVFTFAIEAGGPMAPMLNAMLGPYAEQVATGLLESVGRFLEDDMPEESDS